MMPEGRSRSKRLEGEAAEGSWVVEEKRERVGRRGGGGGGGWRCTYVDETNATRGNEDDGDQGRETN